MPRDLPPQAPSSLHLSRVPWLDASGFLPRRVAGGNAAEKYAEVAVNLRKSRAFPSPPREPEPYQRWADLREAMKVSFEASRMSDCDFLALYSYRAWEENSMPDLPAMLAAARGLALSSRNFLDASQTDAAISTAQAAVGMGEHFLSGAPNVAQALAAQEMLEEGMRALRICYLKTGDEAKARQAAERIRRSRDVVSIIWLRSAAASVDRWKDPRFAAKTLSDPDPIIRADALLLIETCFDAKGRARMREDPVSKGICIRITAEPSLIRQAVEALAEDPSPIVRTLARRAAQAIGK